MYILIVTEDNEKFEYEYGDLKHAREHLQDERSGTIYDTRKVNIALLK